MSTIPLKNIDYVQTIPIGFGYDDFEHEGEHFIHVHPNNKIVTWKSENLVYNDLIFKVPSKGLTKIKIHNCGLKKAFHIGEREDIINVSPSLLGWKVSICTHKLYSVTFNKKFYIRKLGEKYLPENDEVFIRISKYLSSKFTPQLINEDFAQLSFVFQDVTDSTIRLLTIISNDTGQPFDPETVDSMAKTYDIQRTIFMSEQYASSKQAVLEKAVYGKYMLLKNSYVSICDDENKAQVVLGIGKKQPECVLAVAAKLYFIKELTSFEVKNFLRGFISESQADLIINYLVASYKIYSNLVTFFRKKAFQLNEQDLNKLMLSIKNRYFIRLLRTVAKDNKVPNEHVYDCVLSIVRNMGFLQKEKVEAEQSSHEKQLSLIRCDWDY